MTSFSVFLSVVQTSGHHVWLHRVIVGLQTIKDLGVIGWILFVVLYAFCCLFFIPGSVLTLAAGAIYGFWGGLTLVLIGNGLGSVTSLIVARCWLRDLVTKWMAHHPLFQALQRAVAQEDWKLVFLTRLSPIMPFSLINYSLGLTRISLWRFLLATELGAVPAIIVYVYIGTMARNLSQIGREMSQHQTLLWTLRGVGLALAMGIIIYISLLTKKKLAQRLGVHQENT